MSVDDGIVSMKFDNESFERKLGETITSLDKLRASLDLAGATHGLENVSEASKKFDMGAMGGQVDGISAKFLALSTVGITALANITTQVLRTGAQMSSAFTVAPILGGFQEYETNMNSIQTILSNTRADGTNLEQVNAALDQLNAYSDTTIYNFGQMARNIGTFTAAGVSLDTAVPAIKGIANLAAVSGSNAEQASTAMYQLSQAISTGTVRLMDWNSVVNAGMGGEVFQKALFETGKSLGTIEDADLGTTFEEWTAGGNSFRSSLEQGWLTSEVLTNTLQGFTGDLTEAQLIAMGYTHDQALEFMAIGANAQDAASDVKTFSQLMSTIKESIGSSWSKSFRLIIGDFEEAKDLFTNINNAVGDFVTRTSDARNNLLSTWRLLQGRETVIESFKNVFAAFGNVISAVRRAFGTIFPPDALGTLLNLTGWFSRFAETLNEISFNYIPRITQLFKGLFAGIEIGWVIIKNVASLLFDLFNGVAGAAHGPAIGFFGELANKLIELNTLLVEGGAIERFFDRIRNAIQVPMGYLIAFRDAVVSFFDSFSASDKAEGALGRVNDRLSVLQEVADAVSRAWDWFVEHMRLDDLWDYISNWFRDLGSRLADTFSAGDFEEAVDIVNVGLLGGIILAVQRFMRGFDQLDFGSGIVSRIRGALDGLRETMEAMQANLRAQALMRLAIAIGILTASVVVLSLIDSGALTRALGAMAAGFAELMATMAIINRIGINPASFVAITVGLTILATAMFILSMAVTNLSQLDWDELARGLGGAAVGIGMMVVAMRNMPNDMNADSAQLILMAGALLLLSYAVKSFADMSWEEMGQGLLGIAVGLGAMVIAMRSMPESSIFMDSTSAGQLILMAGALLLLSYAVKSFADMSWEEMGQGLLGVAAGLAAMVIALRSMPTEELAISAGGILLISGAMWIMAQAVSSMGSIPFGEMAKGIGGLAVMMLILVLAVNAMTGAGPGAVALIIVAGALLIFTEVLERLGQLSLGQLALGIGAIAAVLLVLAIAAAVFAATGLSAALIALGTGLALVGGAFALFGLGAYLVAKAFEALAAAGQAGADVLIFVIEDIIRELPRLVGAFVLSLIETVTELLDAAPLLIDAVKVLLIKILDTIIEITPKIAEALVGIIIAGLDLIQQQFPEIFNTGLMVLMTILRGIRDNAYELVTMGVEILANLIQGLIDNMPLLVAQGAMMIVNFLQELANHAEDIVAAGLTLLATFLQGIADNIHLVTDAVTNLIITFMAALATSYLQIVSAGANLLIWLLQGIADNIINVVNAVAGIVTQFILAIGTNIQQIIDAGFFVLTQFLLGISDHITDTIIIVGLIIEQFITTVGDKASDIADAGADAVIDFMDGLAKKIPEVADSAVNLLTTFMDEIGESAGELADAAGDMIVDFLDGIADAIEEHMPDIIDAGGRIAGAIADGMTGGLAGRVGDVAGGARDLAGNVLGGIGDAFGIGGPSKEFCKIGQILTLSLASGMDNKALAASSTAKGLAQQTIDSFNEILRKVPLELASMDEFNPVITPVLDLTKVQNGSRNLASMMAISAITPDVSFTQARTIATTTELERTDTETPVYAGPSEVTYVQNNYSPEPLSTGDIYRNTKSQIAKAKEDLGI